MKISVCGSLLRLVTFFGGLNGKVTNSHFQLSINVFFLSLGFLEEKFSNNVIKFCNKKKIFCIDGFNLFNLKTKDTYDLMHLNDKGSKKIAKKIFEEITKNKELNYK